MASRSCRYRGKKLTHTHTHTHTHIYIYIILYNHTDRNDEQVVVKALNFVCDVNPALDHIATDTKLAFFNEARHAYGRTALLLSGGAGGYEYD